jgi:large subunit ribosomal protein L23
MAFLDIFRKKPAKSPPKQAIRRSRQIEKPSAGKPEPKPSTKPKMGKVKAGPKKISKTAWRILKKPHVTEKATDLVKNNEYVFDVYSQANKPEIKKAVEDLYGVNVRSVRIINIPPKKRRLGRIEGWRGGYKKAVVRIKEGQKIEVLPR